MSTSGLHRRRFLGLAATAAARVVGGAEKPVRIGMVGIGNRGAGLLRNLLHIEGVEIPAISDISETNSARALDLVEKSGRRRPELYSRGPEDFRRMVQRDDLDAVMTATPWELHTPVSVAAMKAGKYAATEVPAAVTLEECWQLVDTSEQTRMPCMMLENDCFGRGALMALNLVEQGVLGEIVYCQGGYDHDIRSGLVRNGELSWRARHAARRNGNLYPTHPAGPIGWWSGINRFVRAVRNRTDTPVDVYDSAAWSAIGPLSERSVAARSAPVDFSDFTRGKWKTKRRIDLGV